MSDIEIAKQSARGSFILFIGQFIFSVISAAAVIIIARLLGPSQYGLYTLSFLIPGIFYLFVGIGVTSAVTRFSAYHISRKEENIAKRMTLNATLFLLIFGAVLSLANYLAAGYLAVAVLNRPELVTLIELASLMIIGQTVFQVALSAFVGWNSMWAASSTNVLQSILRFGLSVGLVVAGFAVFGAVLGLVTSFLISGLIAAIALVALKLRGIASNNGGRLFHSFSSDVKEMVAYGFPIFAGSLISGLAGQYVTVILASIAINAYVGYYQAANNLTAIVSIVSVAVATALFPAFSRLSGIGSNVAQAFRYAAKYNSFIVTPIIVFLAASASPLMSIFYTSSYSTGIEYLRLLALSNLPIAIGSTVITPFLNGINRTRLSMMVLISGAISLALAVTILGKMTNLGIDGLIYAILVGNLFSTIFGLYLASKYLDARIDSRSALGVLASSAVALFVVYIVPSFSHSILTLIVDAVLFFAVYLTFVPIFGAINADDVQKLDSATEGFGPVGRLTKLVLRYEEFVSNFLWRKKKEEKKTVY